jgi:hypothetical protein
VLAQAPQAWAQTPGPPLARELFIGAKVAPPFAMKAEDGSSILFYSALLQRWSKHRGGIGCGYHLVANHTQCVFPQKVALRG